MPFDFGRANTNQRETNNNNNNRFFNRPNISAVLTNNYNNNIGGGTASTTTIAVPGNQQQNGGVQSAEWEMAIGQLCNGCGQMGRQFCSQGSPFCVQCCFIPGHSACHGRKLTAEQMDQLLADKQAGFQRELEAKEQRAEMERRWGDSSGANPLKWQSSEDQQGKKSAAQGLGMCSGGVFSGNREASTNRGGGGCNQLRPFTMPKPTAVQSSFISGLLASGCSARINHMEMPDGSVHRNLMVGYVCPKCNRSMTVCCRRGRDRCMDCCKRECCKVADAGQEEEQMQQITME